MNVVTVVWRCFRAVSFLLAASLLFWFVAVALSGPPREPLTPGDLSGLSGSVDELWSEFRSFHPVAPTKREEIRGMLAALKGSMGTARDSKDEKKSAEAWKEADDYVDKLDAAVAELLSAQDAAGSKTSEKIRAAMGKIDALVAKRREGLDATATLSRFQPLVRQLFPWPFAIALVVLLMSPDRLSRLESSRFLSRVQSFTIGTFNVALHGSETAATADAAIVAYKQLVVETYDRAVTEHRIGEKFAKLAKAVRKWLADHQVPDAQLETARFTLHVEYGFVDDCLYQPVEYLTYPGGADQSPKPTHGKKGRILSRRFGLIGLAWRAGVWKQKAEEASVDGLIESWAMTRAEAEAKHGRESMIAVPLVELGSRQLALFYCDAEPTNAFGDQDLVHRLSEFVAERAAADDIDLPSAIAAMQTTVADVKIPKLPIFS